MIRYLAMAMFFLLLTIACGGDATPTLEPTPTTEAEPTSEPTATPAPPTSTPEPTATPTPEPSPTPKPTATSVPPPTQAQRESAIDGQFPEIREKMETVEPLWTVYFHSDDWQTPGINTAIDDIFRLLKLENVASHEGYQRIDPGVITAQEPDIIIADSIESIVENPDLSDLHMVQDPAHIPDHVFVLGDDYSFSPDNHHFEETVKLFAAFVYPKVFGHYENEEEGDTHQEKEGEEEHGHGNGDGHSH